MNGFGSKKNERWMLVQKYTFHLLDTQIQILILLPESNAMDFGGGTGWNTTGNIEPGNWLSTFKRGRNQQLINFNKDYYV